MLSISILLVYTINSQKSASEQPRASLPQRFSSFGGPKRQYQGAYSACSSSSSIREERENAASRAASGACEKEKEGRRPKRKEAGAGAGRNCGSLHPRSGRRSSRPAAPTASSSSRCAEGSGNLDIFFSMDFQRRIPKKSQAHGSRASIQYVGRFVARFSQRRRVAAASGRTSS